MFAFSLIVYTCIIILNPPCIFEREGEQCDPLAFVFIVLNFKDSLLKRSAVFKWRQGSPVPLFEIF